MIGPSLAIDFAWLLWFVSWMAAAGWTGRTRARPPMRSELPNRVATVAGFIMVFDWRALDPWRVPLWSAQPVTQWLTVGLAVAGFGICWSARIHLGRMWSGSVTRKSDHRIVDTGPYRWVRHPIYTGLITAAGATTIMTGTLVSLVGLALVVIGFWLKARLEERFLRAELGSESYDTYARGRWMLFPLL